MTKCALLAIFWMFPCIGEFTQVNNMKEVFVHLHSIDSKTLVIFDVDMVLIQPSDPAFQMPNIRRFGILAKCIMKTVPTEKQMMFLSLMTLSSKSILIDDEMPQFLAKLTEKGISTMALTANLTGPFNNIESMEKWRVNDLCNLNIDFTKSAPYQGKLIFDELPSYRGNYSTYLNGILFVNGTAVSKGETLLSFLKKTNLSPERIIFIDDREDNLNSVEEVLSKTPIDYLGLHFLGAQSYPSQLISEDEFTAKWQQLALEAIKLN